MPEPLRRDLELRVLELWAALLETESSALDADGLVTVTDPREFAADRRATVRTARGTIALAAPQDAAVALADPAAFARETEARATAAGIFHYLDREPAAPPTADVRVLAPADRPLLDELVRAARPDEADEAEVDVDHPCAVGIVEDGRLVAIASLLEFGRGAVDVGVLVHPHARRRGYAVAVVADISRRAGANLVQYRCDPENTASAKVAAACGFIAWGVLTIAPR